jgi:hypothetical protein
MPKKSHGETKPPTAEYRAWKNLRNRCNNPCEKDKAIYSNITVHSEWEGPDGYLNFLKHIGRRPSSEHSVDRIDGSKGYEPGNVRWATKAEQARNRIKGQRYITAIGKTMILEDWAKELGCSHSIILNRITYGWSEEKAVTTPVPKVGTPKSQEVINEVIKRLTNNESQDSIAKITGISQSTVSAMKRKYF